jgi:uncharacterized membrane protein YjfL (UPF0719 family)
MGLKWLLWYRWLRKAYGIYEYVLYSVVTAWQMLEVLIQNNDAIAHFDVLLCITLSNTHSIKYESNVSQLLFWSCLWLWYG